MHTEIYTHTNMYLHAVIQGHTHVLYTQRHTDIHTCKTTHTYINAYIHIHTNIHANKVSLKSHAVGEAGNISQA